MKHSIDVSKDGIDEREEDDTGEAWTGPSVRLDLPRGNVIEIRLRSKVTPQEFEKIKKIFELSEMSFVEDDIVETTETKG